MAKLVVLAFLLTQWRGWPAPYLPFLPLLDDLGSPALVRLVCQVLFLTASVCLLTNRWPRVACLVLGLLIFVDVLSSRPAYGNNKVYTGCVLFLIALYQPGRFRQLLCFQVALLYFGAGLNKLLDVDWRSGQFFEAWHGHAAAFMWFSSHLPPLMLSWLVSWSVIITEFLLAVAFVVPSLFTIGIWLGVAYHSTLLAVEGHTFGMFYFAALASYLAFVKWPDRRSRLPLSASLRSPLALREYLLYSPWPYLVIVVLLAMPNDRGLAYRAGTVVVIGILLILSPPTTWVASLRQAPRPAISERVASSA